MAWKGFNMLMDKQRVLVLDARPPHVFAASHIRSSVCVELQGRMLTRLAGPGPPTWSSNCWWDRNVLLVVGLPSRKRKAPDTMASHPIFSYLKEEGLVRSLHLLEPNEDEDDGFTSFANAYPFLVTKSMKATRIDSYPTEIIPGLLFLGDMSHATSYDRLRELQISHVLSIHTEPLKLPKSFVHMYIELEDAPSADIAQHFQQTYEFIEAAKCAQKRVLIHCGAGASRSATVCAAYLMRTKHWGLNDALKFLKDQRSKVNPNPGFVSALHEYSDLLQTKRVNVHIQTRPSSSLWHLDVLKKADFIGSLLLDKESISFGRSADCTVILDHMSISRKHAVLIKQENGEFMLVDNQSTHGTFINGKMLKLATILKRGDKVQFGGSSRSYVLCDKHSCL